MNTIADKIFYNGTIITMDDKNPEVEAVAVNDGRISYAGDYSSTIKLKGDNTELIDLKGNTLLPGFLEPHTHPDLSAVMYDWVDVSGFNNNSKTDVINRLREAADNTPEGEWITGFGYDSILIRECGALTKYELDKISVKHPIMVMIQSMHTSYVNSMALDIVGITKDTEEPKGGKYIRDETNEPNGIVIEQNALMPFLMDYLAKLKKSPQKLLKLQYDRYRRVGITTIWVAGFFPMFPNFLKTMKESVERLDCPVKMSYSIAFNHIESGRLNIKDIDEDSEKFTFTGFKFWYDGSPYTGNMFLEDNYLNSHLMQEVFGLPKDQAGERLYDKKVFKELLEKYHSEGKQLSIHCQGDRAAREILDALDYVIKKHPREDHRHRLEHCALLPEKEIKRAKELNVTVSFHSNHIRFYGEALKEEILGEERTEKLMPARTALNNGLIISFHTDSPMYPAEPLALLKTVVTRETKGGMVIGEDERVSVHEGLKGLTIDAAYQIFREKEIGSIKKGKFADFTVLRESPYRVDPALLDKIEVITTYLNGEDTSKY